jgi:hypothetical protein
MEGESAEGDVEYAGLYKWLVHVDITMHLSNGDLSVSSNETSNPNEDEPSLKHVRIK